METVNNIKAVLADAETRFPEGMELTIVQDNTQFVREALEKVAHTFFEALALVILVVFIFWAAGVQRLSRCWRFLFLWLVPSVRSC